MNNYELIRSRRRSLSLEITKDCRVLVRAPMQLPSADIDRFVQRHEAWIVRHLERRRAQNAAMPEQPDAQQIAQLKSMAREQLPARIHYWSEIMGVTPTGFKVTSARRRFGSCNGNNSLCFSCFLMQYPPEAIDLVIVHELCHIRVKNHSSAFYALLGQYLPDHEERKKLLQ